jgi:hypothetical protein
VLRTLKPDTEGTLPQAGLRHRRDHQRISQRRPVRSLHRYDQTSRQGSAIGKRWSTRTHGERERGQDNGGSGTRLRGLPQLARGREESGSQARRSAKAVGAGAASC